VKIRVLFKFLAIFLIINLFPIVVLADMGSKPSITVELKNMATDNYLIDLLVYDENGENYFSEMNCNDSGEPTEEQIKTLYKINYDGWISESTRWRSYLLMSDIVGNRSYEHEFGYFGTPEIYRIVVVYNSGKMLVSDVIKRDELNSHVILDVNTMLVIEKGSVFKTEVFKCTIITVLLESIIAYIFKIIKELKLRNIILVNIITQVFLHVTLPLINTLYFIKFIVLEIIIVFLEYFLYKKLGCKNEGKVLGAYVMIANLVTSLMTFIIL